MPQRPRQPRWTRLRDVESDVPRPRGRIGIIDFGRVGSLDDALREELELLLIALVREDAGRLAGALIGLGASSEVVDRSRLRDDLAVLLARHSGQGLGEIPVGRAIGEILEVIRRDRLTIPRDLVMLLRVIIMEEGMAVELDPAFRFAETLAPYIRHLLLAQLSPTALARRLERVGVDIAELTLQLPDELHRVLESSRPAGSRSTCVRVTSSRCSCAPSVSGIASPPACSRAQ